MELDYYIHATNQWVGFPHELFGLSMEEIKEGKGDKMMEKFKGINFQ